MPESMQAQKDSMISQGHTDYSTHLYQRRLHIYDNHLKNREGAAKSRLTVKGVTIVDVSDKTQYTTTEIAGLLQGGGGLNRTSLVMEGADG